jgi:hypothetical protein
MMSENNNLQEMDIDAEEIEIFKKASHISKEAVRVLTSKNLPTVFLEGDTIFKREAKGTTTRIGQIKKRERILKSKHFNI